MSTFRLPGSLTHSMSIPVGATDLVIFSQVSTGSRLLWRKPVVKALQAAGFATLELDLLTPAEQTVDANTGQLRFDIGLLADRLLRVVDWVHTEPSTDTLDVDRAAPARARPGAHQRGGVHGAGFQVALTVPGTGRSFR